MKRLALFIMGLGIVALVLYDGYIDCRNTIMVSVGAVGSLEGGYIIPQTIVLVCAGAFVFGTVVAFTYRALSL
jgi:hypothetical protein